MLRFLEESERPFERANRLAHFTASAWVTNARRDRVLMIWHNIYRSWAWTGGHADGETDLCAVARRVQQGRADWSERLVCAKKRARAALRCAVVL